MVNLIHYLKRCIPLRVKVKLKNLIYGPQNSVNDQPVMESEKAADEKQSRILNDQNIRILLVAQYPAIWTSWRSFWKACASNEEVEVHVVVSSFIHPYGGAETFQEMCKTLKQDNVPYFLGQFYDVDSFNPHVIFLQNPYDSTREQPYKSDYLREKGYRIAYIPYGLEMGAGDENINWQFNLPFHHHAWRIFARSDRHKKMYEKYCETGASRVVVTGHPKFDYQLEKLSENSEISPELLKKVAGRKVVVWTPHFSVGLPATWSTYRIYGDFILELTKKYQQLFFIIRPHPLFYKAMQEHGLWTAEDESLFRERCREQENLWLDTSPEYVESFKVADALMTDVGSFLLEFLPTQKPILYLHHPEGVGMNDDGDLVNYLYKAESTEQIEKFLIKLIANQDSKAEERRLAIGEYLYDVDGRAGERICSHIIAAIKCKDEQNLLGTDPASMQKRSADYWSNATGTFLAPADYYKSKEELLRHVLSSLPRLKRALDIGCGDGYFTRLIAEFVDEVEAYDVSPALIQKAIDSASLHNVENINYFVSELDKYKPSGSFDLLVCMGVVSCILDDEKFNYILNQLEHVTLEKGYLLTTDTLSSTDDQIVAGDGGYLAKYRNEEKYLSEFTRRNFKLIHSVDIKVMSERNLFNRLYLWTV